MNYLTREKFRSIAAEQAAKIMEKGERIGISALTMAFLLPLLIKFSIQLEIEMFGEEEKAWNIKL